MHPWFELFMIPQVFEDGLAISNMSVFVIVFMLFVIFCFVFQATTGLERVVGPIEICLVFVPINSARERKSDSNDVSNLWRDWRLKVYKGGKKKAKVTD